MSKDKSSKSVSDSLEEEEDDEELVTLKKQKQQLITEICELQAKLQEEKRRHEMKVYSKFIGFQSGNENKGKGSRKLVELSERMTGIYFEDVTKTLLRENIYEYKGTAATQALHMLIKLTVKIEDKDNFEILDLHCNFPDNQLDTCFSKEMKPWINKFSKYKQFSSLISAFINYIDQSYSRNKVLRRLEKCNYVTKENCNKEEGGFLVHVHSVKNKDHIYFTIQWATRYLEKTLRIQHYFILEESSKDSAFVKKHKKVLKKFSQNTLDIMEIEQVWSEICSAINEEE